MKHHNKYSKKGALVAVVLALLLISSCGPTGLVFRTEDGREFELDLSDLPWSDFEVWQARKSCKALYEYGNTVQIEGVYTEGRMNRFLLIDGHPCTTELVIEPVFDNYASFWRSRRVKQRKARVDSSGGDLVAQFRLTGVIGEISKLKGDDPDLIFEVYKAPLFVVRKPKSAPAGP